MYRCHMQLVPVFQVSDQISSIRDLTEEEARRLKESYVSGVSTPEATGVMRAIYEARCWITCDCRKEHKAPPAMFVKMDEAGHLSLVTLTERIAHLDSCPFSIQRKESYQRTRGLLKNLYMQWVEAASLNVVYPFVDADLVEPQYEALYTIAKSLEIRPKRKLGDYACTHVNGLTKVLSNLAKELSFTSDDNNPYGVILQFFPSRDERVDWKGHFPSPIQLRVERSLDIEQDKGPLAAMFKIGRQSGSNSFVPDTVYLQPVYSRRHMVPICASHERDTLSALITIQRHFAQHHQMIVRIRKTMPASVPQSRGIAFQVQRLGPNGQPLRSVDVVSVNSNTPTWASHSGVATGGVLYHFTKAIQEEPSTQCEWRDTLFSALTSPSDRSSVASSVTPDVTSLSAA
jgi:hypothetical protein